VMMERVIRKFSPFKKGDRVWLDSRNLKLLYPTRKLALKQEGPFLILEVLSPLSYQLKLPYQWKLHPVFHTHLLTLYRENETHGRNFIGPPPDLIDGQEGHEVEAIIGHRTWGRSNHWPQDMR
jgi:hypothetical protein